MTRLSSYLGLLFGAVLPLAFFVGLLITGPHKTSKTFLTTTLVLLAGQVVAIRRIQGGA